MYYIGDLRAADNFAILPSSPSAVDHRKGLRCNTLFLSLSAGNKLWLDADRCLPGSAALPWCMRVQLHLAIPQTLDRYQLERCKLSLSLSLSLKMLRTLYVT